MKNLFRSKAPPGWRGAVWLFHVVLMLLTMLPVAVHAQQEFVNTADLPKYSIKMWVDVWRPDILMFGRWIKPLGDINNDGYDDVAVASFADTTFIFLGGEEFSSEPYMFLLGGGGGIAVGDFNGDRRVDIVTAIVQGRHRLGEPDSERRGKVRLFLGKDTSPPFDTIPDLTFQGQAMEVFGIQANSRRPGVYAIDYDGDGCDDLLFRRRKVDSIPRLCFTLYQGGSRLDTMPVAYFEERKDFPPDYYADDLMIGDLNSDGKDDVLVHGSNSFSAIPGRVPYWDLYLGNESFLTAVPDRIISSDQGWSPIEMGLSGIIDINADGHADILDGSPAEPGDVQLFLSSRDLPNTILTNDTIVNPDFPWSRNPSCICPVGDMNGDGRPDLLVSWVDAFFPLGDLYLLYPGAPDNSYKTPLGVFGILKDEHHLQLGAYPIGDVNGDGCEDVAVLGEGTSTKNSRFRIYLGSRLMETAIGCVPDPHTLHFEVHPNPVLAEGGQVTIIMNSSTLSPVRLSLTDILGKEVFQSSVEMTSESQCTTLPVNELVPGRYQITVTQGQTLVSQPMIVY